MRFTSTQSGEERVAEMQKKARRALKAKERERQEQRDKMAKLKALRLIKEAAERKAAEEGGTAETHSPEPHVRSDK